MKTRISLSKGTIVVFDYDAIINAANSTLLGGNGVDGAIHKAAGIGLLNECSFLNGCPTGEAKITQGYKLPAKHVIHTVGPMYNPNRSDNATLLKDCYLNSLKIAKEKGLKTIAFPAISTGVYRYPFQPACNIALNTTLNFIEENPNVFKTITFVLFTDINYSLYLKTLGEMKGDKKWKNLKIFL